MEIVSQISSGLVVRLSPLGKPTPQKTPKAERRLLRDLVVSYNKGTPKSSIVGFSIIYKPSSYWGTPMTLDTSIWVPKKSHPGTMDQVALPAGLCQLLLDLRRVLYRLCGRFGGGFKVQHGEMGR